MMDMGFLLSVAFFIASEGNMGTSNEEVIIKQTSKASSHKGSNPVNPMVSPIPASQGRAEGPSRVHGCPREWPPCQDVGPHHKPHNQWTQPAGTIFLGSTMVPYAVNKRENVSTISIIIPWTYPIHAASVWTGVTCTKNPHS